MISKCTTNASAFKSSAAKFLSPFLLVLCVCLSTPSSGQSSTAASPSEGGKRAEIFELGEAFVLPSALGKQQSRLIFYRASNSTFKGSASIYFNGMYHATLGRNGFSSLCANPGVVNLGVKSVMVGYPLNENFESTSTLGLKGGRNHYMRVIEDRKFKVLQPVSEADALAELSATREQIHTMSRVTTAQVCRSEVVSTPVLIEPVQTTIILGADALFDFAASDRKALGFHGRMALDQLIADVNANYSSIDQVNVFGHTDPIGTMQQNERISVERAKTVRDYLQENGLQSTRISAQGRGDSELVVKTCGRTATTNNIACNTPNRRVTVEIHGTKR